MNSKSKIIVVGAGLSGIMTAKYFSSHNPVIYEMSDRKIFSDEHAAVMRVKGPEVGMILGCPMKKINISKAIYADGKLHNEPDIRLKNMYSLKVTGTIAERSIDYSSNRNDERFIFTQDSIPKYHDVRFRTKIKRITDNREIISICDRKETLTEDVEIIISTIPMPAMLEITGVKHSIKFEYQPIKVTTADINVQSSVHQTIYFPELGINIYRATLENRKMMIESINDWPTDAEIDIVKWCFSVSELSDVNTKEQRFGKITAVDDSFRRSIIMELTQRFNVYSIGRFATWNPAVKADDVVNDLKRIEKLINLSEVNRKYESYID